MPAYRMYFLDDESHFLWAEVIEAKNDAEALRLAQHLHDACSDVCEGYAVWQLTRRVGGSGTAHASKLTPLEADLQERLVEREISMRDSYTALARSARLLKRLGIGEVVKSTPSRSARR